MAQKKLPPGKVPWDVLADRLKSALPEDVILGPAHGEDAALVKIGDEVWAVASDPITFTTHEAGRLSVIVNANDVAVRGARPRFFTAVVLLSPASAGEEEVADIFEQIRETADSLGVAWIGGHTEVTADLPHTIIAGTMLGPVEKRAIITGGLQPGDRIAMTKKAGLEGTSILLAEFPQRFKKLLGEGPFDKACQFFDTDWLSIVPEAALAATLDEVIALHDVTEGGVGEALHEMASASGLSIEAFPDKIPLLPETREICAHMGMDPLGLLGSGALLIGCQESGCAALENKMGEKGIPFAWIARAKEASDNPATGLPRFERDEILKAWNDVE
ncbi:MAG: AIR synthase related protein [Planctomycetota bacterium]